MTQLTTIPDKDAWRLPTLDPTDTAIFTEPGRVIGNVDHTSHAFRLVRPAYGPLHLFVKHGGGEERIPLAYNSMMPSVASLAAMPADDRYLTLRLLHSIHREAARRTREAESTLYRRAFCEGRLKKRKLPSKHAWKVWIEDAATPDQEPSLA